MFSPSLITLSGFNHLHKINSTLLSRKRSLFYLVDRPRYANRNHKRHVEFLTRKYSRLPLGEVWDAFVAGCYLFCVGEPFYAALIIRYYTSLYGEFELVLMFYMEEINNRYTYYILFPRAFRCVCYGHPGYQVESLMVIIMTRVSLPADLKRYLGGFLLTRYQ